MSSGLSLLNAVADGYMP